MDEGVDVVDIFYEASSFVVGLGSALVPAERGGVSCQRLVIWIVRTMLPMQALNVGSLTSADKLYLVQSWPRIS